MEQLDQIIKEAVEPYLDLIEQMKQKQKEKEAEVMTLKFAIMEIERKFQELEKKIKTAAPSTGATGRATARNTKPLNTAPTPRAVPKKVEPAAARQRSRTPVSSKMQSNLNSSIAKNAGAASGLKSGPAKGKVEMPNSRNNSNTRNQPLSSTGGLKR